MARKLICLGLALLALAFYYENKIAIGVCLWFGANFLTVGLGHARGWDNLFGKRPNGTLPFLRTLYFLPFLIFTWIVWYIFRSVNKDDNWNEVNEQLVLGRRLLSSEFSGQYDTIVDLTSEFNECAVMRNHPGYVNIPWLDYSAPTPEALKAAVQSVKPGRLYIHCAQGRGRTALFAAAYALEHKMAGTIDEAMALLRAKRPKVRLSSVQRKCIEGYVKLKN